MSDIEPAGLKVTETLVGASQLHKEGLEHVPEEFKVLYRSDGSTYAVFGASKGKHLERSANEAATLFATKNGEDQVAIKIFLGWQTLFPEVKAAQFHDEILAIPEAEREKLLIDTPENRLFWADRFSQHDFGEGYKADILTAESFVHLLAGPAVTLAAMRLMKENQLELLGYGFVSNKGELTMTDHGRAQRFMRYEDGHPALMTRYIQNLVLLDDSVERSPQLPPPPGVASLEIYKKYKLEATVARKKLIEAGFTDYDVEVYLDSQTSRVYIMDLGQVIPFTKESVDSCIFAVIDMYNLPEMFVRMLANKYWEDLKKRKAVASEIKPGDAK